MADEYVGCTLSIGNRTFGPVSHRTLSRQVRRRHVSCHTAPLALSEIGRCRLEQVTQTMVVCRVRYGLDRRVSL